MSEDWSDKKVIVTGGGGGMGQAAAKRFAEAGAEVFVLGRTLASLEESAAMSERITPIVCDVADAASAEAAVAQAVGDGAGLDALIHTAGINTPDRYLLHDDSEKVASADTWKAVMDINVLGVVHMVQAAVPSMAASGGGKIIVVSSTAGHGFDSFAGVPYTASKWAVHGLLFTARQQLNAHNIVVSEYAPGEANTPLVAKRPVQPAEAHREAMIQSEDCGDAIYFIASQSHSVSLIQLPVYQPFGGMPPQIPAPWLPGLEIGPRTEG